MLASGTGSALESPVQSVSTSLTRGDSLVGSLFSVAWCGVGGARGGQIVPRWFRVLPDLGIQTAHLFWSMPDAGTNPGPALDQLRSASTRWLAELSALGVEGDLVIKRGVPGSWLADLAALSPEALVVLGPSTPASVSTTVYDLLRNGSTPLLLLPDLVPPPVRLLERPVIDAGEDPNLDGLVEAMGQEAGDLNLIDLDHLEPPDAVLTALRVAEDVDATLLVLPRRPDDLVPYAIRRSNFPLLVWPGGGTP
jgi:hypothetical protein